MWDIGCIAASVAFFLLAIAYTTGCARLGTPATTSSTAATSAAAIRPTIGIGTRTSPGGGLTRAAGRVKAMRRLVSMASTRQ